MFFGKKISIWVSCCLLIVIFCFGTVSARQSLLQQGIAEEVLRFHILANSDSEEDQNTKYRVRDAIMEWMSQQMENVSNYKLANRDAVIFYAQAHLTELEQVANQILEEDGMGYRATAEIVRCYFPDRTYGDCTFPAGWYDALRIRLGEAKGQNWWCVLYPQLCFKDCLHAVVDEEQLTELEEVLTVEEYESLLQKPQRWKLAFRWF